MNNELINIAKANRRERQEKDAQVVEYDKRCPQSVLNIRSPEGRAFFVQIKDLPLQEQVAAIQQMPDHFVRNLHFESNGSAGTEINAVLEFLGASKRVGYAHGFRGAKTDFSSNWGYFDPQKDIYYSFVGCDIPKKSKDALVFVLKLS